MKKKNQKKRNNIFYEGVKICRWTTPAGALFLFWPTLWGLILGAQGLPRLKHVLLCALGAWLMRSAGCVYNDAVDRDLDRHVTRTAQRPLAAGTLSLHHAGFLLVGLLSCSASLLFFFNREAILLCIASLPLVGLYPWLKRWTYWPQIFLGIAFNWGMLVGYALEAQIFSWEILSWFLFGTIWTIIYDTIYAHQDIQDDLRAGIKSSALALRDRTKKILNIMIIALFVNTLLMCIYNNKYILMIFITFMLWRVIIDLRALSLSSPHACGLWFKKSAWWGAWISLGLIISFKIYMV